MASISLSRNFVYSGCSQSLYIENIRSLRSRGVNLVFQFLFG